MSVGEFIEVIADLEMATFETNIADRSFAALEKTQRYWLPMVESRVCVDGEVVLRSGVLALIAVLFPRVACF